ncbi:MAG: DNA-methyltransferase [Syntrophomonadaceae bacterium]|jgi:adenine-specific DNA-methyltransferase
MNKSTSTLFKLDADYTVDMSVMDNLVYLNKIPDGSIHLIVTSPPYNIGKKYEKKASLENYIADQAAIIKECVRVLHPNGSLCWQVGNHIGPDKEVIPLDAVLYPLFKDNNLIMRNRIIWHFEHGLHCKYRFSGRYETIMWFTKSPDYTFNLDAVRVPSKYPGKKYFKGPRKGQISCNPLGKNPGDVWVIPNVKANHCEKTIHPCQFPVELVERLVLALTNEGDTVLDPYLGVGSTVIAAIKNNRNGCGCDTVSEYIDLAWDRVSQYWEGTLKTRPMDRPIYDPTLPGGGQ